MAYLNLQALKLQTVMPPEFLDELESRQPGWIDAQLARWSGKIDARLRKRYRLVPFAAPYPTAVLGWLSDIVTLRVALRRGIDPNDEQASEYKTNSDTAEAEIKEAADGELGLFDLPIAAGGDSTGSGIALGGARVYSETSPYAWADRQSDDGRNEDDNRRGTFR